MHAAPPLAFGELLVAANILSQKTVDSLLDGLELSARQIARKLLSTGYLSDKSCVIALRCLSLNTEGFLANKDCAEILRQCVSYDANLDEQLAAWGHFVPNRMQWIWR